MYMLIEIKQMSISWITSFKIITLKVEKFKKKQHKFNTIENQLISLFKFIADVIQLQ